MVTSGQLPAQRIARWLVSAVDGEHAWGSIQASVDRRGAISYCLTVFPPGLPPSRRRWVRLWSSWPTVGVALLLPTLVAGHVGGSVRLAFAIALAGYLLGALIVFRAASPERSLVRELYALDARGGEGPGEQHLELERLVDTLAQAEIAHDRGRLDSAGFERIWSEVYEQIGNFARARRIPPRRDLQ